MSPRKNNFPILFLSFFLSSYPHLSLLLSSSYPFPILFLSSPQVTYRPPIFLSVKSSLFKKVFFPFCLRYTNSSHFLLPPSSLLDRIVSFASCLGDLKLYSCPDISREEGSKVKLVLKGAEEAKEG